MPGSFFIGLSKDQVARIDRAVASPEGHSITINGQCYDDYVDLEKCANMLLALIELHQLDFITGEQFGKLFVAASLLALNDEAKVEPTKQSSPCAGQRKA